jgi:hypothetical protein
MVKDLVAGGASVLTAIGGVVYLASHGFPLPANDDIKNLLVFVIGPFGALGGYVLGRMTPAVTIKTCPQCGYRLPGKVPVYVVLGTMIFGAFMAVLYVSNVVRPVSPGGKFFLVAEAIPFMLSFTSFYTLVWLAGLKLASPSANGQHDQHRIGDQKKDPPQANHA